MKTKVLVNIISSNVENSVRWRIKNFSINFRYRMTIDEFVRIRNLMVNYIRFVEWLGWVSRDEILLIYKWEGTYALPGQERS